MGTQEVIGYQRTVAVYLWIYILCYYILVLLRVLYTVIVDTAMLIVLFIYTSCKFVRHISVLVGFSLRGIHEFRSN